MADKLAELMDTLSAGVADLVMSVEAGNADAAKMCEQIVEAIVKSRVTSAPAQVNVALPTPTNGWTFDFEYFSNGAIKTMIAKRTKGE